jgi:hypothetical protein
MIEPTLQDKIFDIVLSRYPRRADAVEDLCELLNLARDPIYRRLRGDTVLSPQELSKLAHQYRFSLDTLVFGQSDNVVCNYNAFSRKMNEFSDFLEMFIEDFELVNKLPNPHLRYASAELPVFSYNLFPELISFKMYIWARTTWNFEWLRERPFSFDLITAPILRLSDIALQHYLRLDSTELWTAQIMDNSLAQIEYHVYSGGFKDPKDALVLMDKLKEWTVHMKQVCHAGKKFAVGEKPELGRGKFAAYHNEIVYANISGLITSDVGKVAYIAFCTPNFMKSTDSKLCEYTQNWFDMTISKSVPLCTGSEKERDWYFRELNQKIDRRRQKIELYIEDNA